MEARLYQTTGLSSVTDLATQLQHHDSVVKQVRAIEADAQNEIDELQVRRCSQPALLPTGRHA